MGPYTVLDVNYKEIHVNINAKAAQLSIKKGKNNQETRDHDDHDYRHVREDIGRGENVYRTESYSNSIDPELDE